MRISIITINLNNAVGLQNTIESVINQSYLDIEYIIIDGNSNDLSTSIIRRNEKYISYWVSEKDRGIYDAMNKGILASTGEYLLFLNSGDTLLHNQTIQEVVNIGLYHELVYGNLTLINRGKERTWSPPAQLSFGFFLKSALPHPATFIKRSLFTKVGLFDEALFIVSDWKFFLLAICRDNCSYKHVNVTISRFNEDGISSDPKNSYKIEVERGEVLKMHFPAFIDDYKDYFNIQQEFRNVRLYAKLKKRFRFNRGPY